jgi:hypothetical protein
MCAPQYIVVTGDAPDESINKFLEDYLPDGWRVEWNIRGTDRIALVSDRGRETVTADRGRETVTADKCLAYDAVHGLFRIERLKLLIDLLLDENLAHFSPMKGLHQFRACLDLSKLKTREKL